jgi:LuxR family maltose regulon positive regulatory protein
MPKKFSSIAKITRPRLSGVVPRMRLFNLLDSGRDKSVTWISGPGGSGKTTLIASYLDTRKLPCLWYQMDEGDGDIATFFYYLGLAAKKAAPRSRKLLPFLTPEYLQGITTFTLRYFENLYSRLKPPCVLVFDSYQDAPSDSRLHEVMKEGLSTVPDGIHVIVMSRSGLPPEFARLRANNKINLIGWDELKFTLDEAREFLRNKGHQELAEEVLKTLHSRTEGWAAGLVLLLEGLENKVKTAAVPEKLKLEEIFNYFAKEIFEKCQIEIQDFLLETSFLPKITLGMADALTGRSKARQILAELNQKNYFTQRQASESEVYQYHPLFREFLRAQAQESFSAQCILDIKRNAATVLESEGYIEDAVELFRDSGEWQEAARLILQQAPAMVAQGRGQTLADWIQGLTESIFEQNPFLCYWLGISLMPYNPAESLHHLERAFHFFEVKKDPTGIFLACSGVIDAIVHGFHTFKQLDKWISIVYKLRTEYKDFPSEEIGARVTMSMLSAFCLRQPQHSDYEAWSERALSLVQMIGDGAAKLQTFMVLVLYRLFSGELSKAAVFIDSFREAAQSPNITPLALITLKDLETFYYWLTANFEECHKAATDGLELASSRGIHIFDYFIVGHGAAGALSAGDMERAERFLQELTSRLDGATAWGKNLYHTLVAWKALLQKDFPQALLHAELGLQLSFEAGMPQTEAIARLGMALVMHELKREKEASAHIDEVHAISRSTNIYQVEFGCLLAEARFALDRGENYRARDFLRKAMALGIEQGYFNTYFWLPSVMAGLCVEALEAGIEVEYVQNLIRKRSLIPETPPLECENWPWLFRLHTLGGFELKKDGKPMVVPQKPLSLLKALISFGGGDVAGERLAYELWPDSEGDAAHTSLEVTLLRLRRLIGSEKAIQLKAGNVSLDPYSFWVDVWALEHIYDKLAKCLRRVEEPKGGKTKRREIEDEKNDIMHLADKALGLYKGHFLPSDTSCSWTLGPRGSWRSKFLRIITMTGSYLEGLQQHQKAVEYYQKGLEVDNLAEEFYQHLMICYRELGRKAEAMVVYNRCCDALSSTLDANPSPATEAIYSSLRRSCGAA